VSLILEEADRQNLISSASREQIWARHIVDSAQLLTLSGSQDDETGLWVDLGTGAGFPGLVIACLREAPIQLIEVRPLRAAFLQRCVEDLGLVHANVAVSKAENVELQRPAAIISARAYAPLSRLLTSAGHLADENTHWLLPKGRQGNKELEIARAEWQAVFHVKHSVTDPESAIVTVDNLKGPIPSTGQKRRTRFARQARKAVPPTPRKARTRS